MCPPAPARHHRPTPSLLAVRASSLNPKTLAYANNIQFTTDKGNKFTYVFSN